VRRDFWSENGSTECDCRRRHPDRPSEPPITRPFPVASSASCTTVEATGAELCEVRPLVAMGVELAHRGTPCAELASFMLERQGDQVAKTSPWHRVLVRKHRS